MKKPSPSKAETALLPPFAGLPLAGIVVPGNPAQCAAARAELLAAGCAGFDTESKPTFLPGQASDGPHLVQLALPDKAFLFQLHRPGCREALAELLQSTALLKVGFGLQSDRGQIRAKFGVAAGAVLDLNSVFQRLGYRSSMGVRAAVGVVFGQRFQKSKKTTTSNWALPQLSSAQLLYAANDAFAALRVWQALRQQHGDRLLAGQDDDGDRDRDGDGDGDGDGDADADADADGDGDADGDTTTLAGDAGRRASAKSSRR